MGWGSHASLSQDGDATMQDRTSLSTRPPWHLSDLAVSLSLLLMVPVSTSSQEEAMDLSDSQPLNLMGPAARGFDKAVHVSVAGGSFITFCVTVTGDALPSPPRSLSP